MLARRRGREAALQILYQIDLTALPAVSAVDGFWEHLVEDELDPFTNQLVYGTMHRLSEIDETIRKVSHHWRIERMAKVDRNILRLGTFELLGLPEVPRKVTLNEAVELAKRFGSEGSAGFVNGVLDRIASDLKKS